MRDQKGTAAAAVVGITSIVSLTTGWFTECQRRVTHPQVRQMHTVSLSSLKACCAPRCFACERYSMLIGSLHALGSSLIQLLQHKC